MIKINDKSISSVYDETTGIEKIMKGTLKVYEAFKKLIASGVPPITLQKCKGVDLVDYKIYGNSVQDTIGKNLLNINNYIITGNPTFEIVDGHIIARCDFSNRFTYKFTGLDPNKKYTFSFKKSEDSKQFFYVNDNRGNWNATSNPPTTVTPTTDGTLSFLFATGDNGQWFDYEIWDLQLEEGATQTDYEEYKTLSPKYPFEVESVGDKTKNYFDISKSIKSSLGLELSENEDGSYNLRGTIRQNYSYLTIYDLDVPIPTGTYVTLSSYFDTSITDACIGAICYDADGVMLRQGNGITNGGHLVYRATNDIAKLGMVWRLPTSKAGDYVELNNIRLQLEIGSKKTDYEPYGYKIPVKASGKNMAGNWEHGWIDTNGNLSERTDRMRTGYIEIKNETYRVSGGITYTNYTLYDENYNFIYGKGIGGNSNIYNSTYKAKYVRIAHPNTNVSSIQLELGDATTDYEPYVESITTNIYLNEPLRKIGDYADYIDFEKQLVIRPIKKLQLVEGSKIYSWQGKQGITFVGALDTSYNRNPNTMCNREFVFNISTTTPSSMWVGVNSNILYWIGILDVLSLTTLDEFNEWLTNNPTYLYYVSSLTPIEETIELPNIPTHKGTTIIEVDTNVSPSNMEVKYYGKE